MAILDEVTFWMRKDARKHGLLRPDQTEEDYVREKVNAMSPYELLEAISSAIEDTGEF